jgi:hypothetical protein
MEVIIENYRNSEEDWNLRLANRENRKGDKP